MKNRKKSQKVSFENEGNLTRMTFNDNPESESIRDYSYLKIIENKINFSCLIS